MWLEILISGPYKLVEKYSEHLTCDNLTLSVLLKQKKNCVASEDY